MSIVVEPSAPTKRPRRKPGEPEALPFTVAIDTREQNAFGFQNMVSDKGRPLIVPTQLATLTTGDYSIVGCELLVCAERKNHSDLLSTLTAGRDRFEAEHQRMRAMGPGRAVVVIEADWPTILTSSSQYSRLNPLSVHRTAVSWLVKYGVPWVACPGRRYAEVWTLDFLRKFWDATTKGE